MQTDGFDAAVLPLVGHNLEVWVVQDQRVYLHQLHFPIFRTELSQGSPQQSVEFLEAVAIFPLQEELQEHDSQFADE